VSAALRAREEQAIQRIADALGFVRVSDRLRADELEEMAVRAEHPARRLWEGEPFPVERAQQPELFCNGVFPDEIDEDPADDMSSAERPGAFTLDEATSA
jgi:hypothetical protein